MPKYLVLFSLSSNAMAGFVEKPEDRRGPVSQLAEAAGGRLEAYYWMFGPYDGMGILETPNSEAMASLALAVTSTGAFKPFETHELFAADNLVGIAQRAQGLRSGYRPPGGPTP